MKRVEEGLSLPLMASAALLHHLGTEARFVDAGYRVRSVAVLAGRVVLFGIRILRPVDAGAELLFDAVMAYAARGGNVLRVDQGAWILGRELRVRAVTVGAGCSHDQPALDQTPSVDAVLVAADDIVYVGIDARCCRLADAVTRAAQQRYIARVGRRRRPVIIERCVPGMAVLANRRIRVLLREKGSVGTRLVLRDLFGMADAAVDARLDGCAGAFLRDRDIGVALTAGGIRMH